MNEQKPHSILHNPHEYDLTDFHYHLDKDAPSSSFIDMKLEKNSETITLRFWQPVNLKIEEGFPYPTRGMVFYDVTANCLENIGVEVSDFEATYGSVTFSAKFVKRV
jgi:hypothetical protein